MCVKTIKIDHPTFYYYYFFGYPLLPHSCSRRAVVADSLNQHSLLGCFKSGPIWHTKLNWTSFMARI